MAGLFNLNQIVRKNILELTPYRCARDDYSDGILLDANENSFGSTVSSYPQLSLHRYPDPLHYDLKEEIAKFRGHSVQKEQIFLGVGSDEAIDILFRIFCNPKEDNVVITPPTYGMYKVCAKINDVQVKLSPLTPEFDVDVPTVQAQVDGKTKLIFLCSPGNPTSKLVPLDIIETLANLYPNVMIIVDEAYIDFNLEGTTLQILQKYPNIIVLQTLSKAFGLAGIRLGMAFASPEIIQIMNNVKAPYNINKLTVNVAKEAFEKSLNHYKENLQNLVDQRAFLHQELAKLPYIQRIYPSHANFILFRIPRSHAIYKTMADRGIVCRYRGTELHCDECLRVSVGTQEENQRFLALLDAVAKELNVA